MPKYVGRLSFDVNTRFPYIKWKVPSLKCNSSATQEDKTQQHNIDSETAP
eukprot:m.1658414 g.1658414  ORF g.1658414 m.1658414 type:complete len:50 (-) comp116431_c0_seq1:147-296(-)